MASTGNPKFDRLVASKVFGWPIPVGTAAPRFSSSPAAAIGGLLRSAVPDDRSSSRPASSSRIELSAVRSRWKLAGQLTLESTSDDQRELELPSLWHWSDSPEVLAPVLEKAASERQGKPLEAFSPRAFRLLCCSLGFLDGLLGTFPGRCGFRLEWPVASPHECSSVRWRSTIELIPGSVRGVGGSTSPAEAVAQSERQVLQVLVSEWRGAIAGWGTASGGPDSVVPPSGALHLFGIQQKTEAETGRRRSDQGADDQSSASRRTPALASPLAPSTEQLRRWRTERSLTQKEAGLLVGVSRRGWQSWELGTNPVPRWMSLALEALKGRTSPGS